MELKSLFSSFSNQIKSKIHSEVLARSHILDKYHPAPSIITQCPSLPESCPRIHMTDDIILCIRSSWSCTVQGSAVNSVAQVISRFSGENTISHITAMVFHKKGKGKVVGHKLLWEKSLMGVDTLYLDHQCFSVVWLLIEILNYPCPTQVPVLPSTILPSKEDESLQKMTLWLTGNRVRANSYLQLSLYKRIVYLQQLCVVQY